MVCKTSWKSYHRAIRPIKKVKVSFWDKPWFNAGCRKATRARKKVHKKWRSFESEEDRASFITARNKSVKAPRQATANYKQKFVDKLKSAPEKRLRSVVKEALPSSKSTSIPSLHVERVMIRSGQEKTDALAQTLSKVSQLDESGVSPPPFLPRTNAQITSVNISISKMLRALGQRDVTKALGPNMIPNLILKRYAPKLAGPLASLYRKCFAAGSFPKTWKTAYVVPVPKVESDLTNAGSHRPISMLSCVDKFIKASLTGPYTNTLSHICCWETHNMAFATNGLR